MLMNQEEKVLAEAVLRHLCVGLRICGANFYPGPVLVINDGSLPNKEDIYLTVESEWRIFDEVPAVLPIIQYANDIPDRKRISELISAVGYLTWHKIIDVKLGDSVPHLLLKFDNGQTLYVNGHHDKYESWNIHADKFTVVAIPGDGVAIWHPEGFSAGA